LAWKAANHNVNNSSPRPSVKSLHIGPDRKRLEDAIALSLNQDGLSVFIPLDSTDASVSKQLSSEDAASGPGKKM
jgi:hypothetical protein